MSTTPAVASLKPCSCTNTPRSRARLPGWQEIYNTRRGASAATAANTSRAPVRGGSRSTWLYRWRRHGQVAGMELGVADAVQMRVAASTRDQRALAFNPDDVRCVPGEREREVAEAAEKIQHPGVRRGREQFERP